MIQIRKDVSKNRVYIKLKGFFQDEDVKSACEQILSAVKGLAPGFDVINDISEFKPASSKASEYISHLQEEVVKLQVGRIVRIVGNNVLGKMQLARTSQKAVGYRAYNVAAMQDALNLLDSEK